MILTGHSGLTCQGLYKTYQTKNGPISALKEVGFLVMEEPLPTVKKTFLLRCGKDEQRQKLSFRIKGCPKG